MTVYVPILALQKNKPYQVTRLNEWGDNIQLYLRGYEEDTQEIMSLLLPTCYHRSFKRLWQLNQKRNGETAKMKLKYYGTDVWGGRPIIRISGREFVKYLW
jgi:hypothetical protein